jgi:hypothetical protein
MKCPWCADPKSEADTGLCNMHEAERLGITEQQLEAQIHQWELEDNE